MRTRFGLALGAGGAKGVAHIGALQALSDNGITPDVITGCSAGSAERTGSGSKTDSAGAALFLPQPPSIVSSNAVAKAAEITETLFLPIMSTVPPFA